MRGFFIRFTIILVIYSLLALSLGLAYSSLQLSSIASEQSGNNITSLIAKFAAPYLIASLILLTIVLIDLKNKNFDKRTSRTFLVIGVISTGFLLFSMAALVFRVGQIWQGKIAETGSMAGATEVNLAWIMGYSIGISLLTLVPSLLKMNWLKKPDRTRGF